MIKLELMMGRFAQNNKHTQTGNDAFAILSFPIVETVLYINRHNQLK